MNKKIILLIVSIVLLQSSLYADDRPSMKDIKHGGTISADDFGNGGDLLFCETSSDPNLIGWLSSDFVRTYDPIDNEGVPVSVKSWEESRDRIYNRLLVLLPDFAFLWKDFVDSIGTSTNKHRIWTRAPFGLENISDEDLIHKLPGNCIQKDNAGVQLPIFHQFVTRIASIENQIINYSFDAFVYSDSNGKSRYDWLRENVPLQFSYAMFHEVLHDFFLPTEPRRAQKIAKINRKFHSKWLDTVNKKEFLEYLKEQGMGALLVSKGGEYFVSEEMHKYNCKYNLSHLGNDGQLYYRMRSILSSLQTIGNDSPIGDKEKESIEYYKAELKYIFNSGGRSYYDLQRGGLLYYAAMASQGSWDLEILALFLDALPTDYDTCNQDSNGDYNFLLHDILLMALSRLSYSDFDIDLVKLILKKENSKRCSNPAVSPRYVQDIIWQEKLAYVIRENTEGYYAIRYFLMHPTFLDLELLMSLGFNKIDLINPLNGENALHLSAYYQQEKYFQKLLDSGANYNLALSPKWDIDNVLGKSLPYDYRPHRYLDDINADFNSIKGQGKVTLLMRMFIDIKPVFLNTLLSRENIAINAQSSKGDTALIFACKYGTEDEVKILLKHGADKTIANKAGETPFSIAKSRNDKVKMFDKNKKPFSKETLELLKIGK